MDCNKYLQLDIANFRVGQHVLVTGPDQLHRTRGVLTEIRRGTPFPGVVTLSHGGTVLVLPWEIQTVPASSRLADVETWLDEP